MGQKVEENWLNQSDKKMCYIDEQTGNYVELECRLNSTPYEAREFISSIERMKLDSSIMNGTLKHGKTSSHLIREYKKLFQSDVIDFSKILDLYNKKSRNLNVAMVPILSFLKLFDVKVTQLSSSLEVYTSLTKSRNTLFSTDAYDVNRKKIKSIPANTEVFSQPIMKMHSIDVEKIGGYNQEKTLIKSNGGKVNVAMC